MARIRSVKPDYWEDEKIAALCRDSRLLFIGLWNHADDEGRMRANPRYVKSKVFPYDDDVDVACMLAELSRMRLICLYKSGCQEYLWVRNFKRHQKIDRPQPSQLPAPPEECVESELQTSSASTLHPFDDTSTNALRTIDGGVEWSGVDKEGSGEGVGDARTRRPTLESCKKLAVLFGGTEAQAEKLFWHYEGNGWPSNGLEIRVDAVVKKWLLGDAERALADTRGSPRKKAGGRTLDEMNEENARDLRAQGFKFDGE